MKKFFVMVLTLASIFCFTTYVSAAKRCDTVDFIEIRAVGETEEKDFSNVLSNISIIHYTNDGEKEFLASDLEGEIDGTDDHYSLNSTDGYLVEVEKVNGQVEVIVSKGYAASKIVL